MTCSSAPTRSPRAGPSRPRPSMSDAPTPPLPRVAPRPPRRPTVDPDLPPHPAFPHGSGAVGDGRDASCPGTPARRAGCTGDRRDGKGIPAIDRRTPVATPREPGTGDRHQALRTVRHRSHGTAGPSAGHGRRPLLPRLRRRLPGRPPPRPLVPDRRTRQHRMSARLPPLACMKRFDQHVSCYLPLSVASSHPEPPRRAPTHFVSDRGVDMDHDGDQQLVEPGERVSTDAAELRAALTTDLPSRNHHRCALTT